MVGQNLVEKIIISCVALAQRPSIKFELVAPQMLAVGHLSQVVSLFPHRQIQRECFLKCSVV